jgi:hypothetical protein
VLSMSAKGYSYDEIAQLLKLSRHTVETYVKRIYKKLQVHSKTQDRRAGRQSPCRATGQAARVDIIAAPEFAIVAAQRFPVCTLGRWGGRQPSPPKPVLTRVDNRLRARAHAELVEQIRCVIAHRLLTDS